MIITIDDSNFDDILKTHNKIIINFFAPWCNLCNTISPLLEDIATVRNDITIAKINIDDYPDICAKYNINGVPALLKIEKCIVLDTFIGEMKLPALNKFIG